MFDVIPVVEEQKVVNASVVAGRAACVLEEPLKLTNRETDRHARQIDGHEEPRADNGDGYPQSRYERGVDEDVAARAKTVGQTGVMRQVPIAPQALRHAEQEGQIPGVDAVQQPLTEERPVDEVV